MFQRIICILGSYPSYFYKNISKASKFLVFIHTVEHSILNVFFLFFLVKISLFFFLTIWLVLYAFIFFNIGNRYEDRIWKLFKYDRCRVILGGAIVWLGKPGRKECISVCKYLSVCAYGAVTVDPAPVHFHPHHYLEHLLWPYSGRWLTGYWHELD